MLDRMRPSVLASVVAWTLAVHPAPASAGQVKGRADFPVERSRAERHIIDIVRSRTADPRILGKMQEKLSALDPVDVQLAASLCDRIEAQGAGAGAEIAFSIVTALIVLS